MSILQWFRKKFVPGDHSPLQYQPGRYYVTGVRYLGNQSLGVGEQLYEINIGYQAGDNFDSEENIFDSDCAITIRNTSKDEAMMVADKVINTLNARERYKIVPQILNNTQSETMR